MSSDYAWGLLTVECDSPEQVSQLLADYENITPELGYFAPEIDDNKPNQINFPIDYEVISHFEKEVLALDKWIFEKSSHHLAGYWLLDAGERYCFEIENGEISSASFSWLEEYPVEKIERIKSFAQSIGQKTIQDQTQFEPTGDLFMDIYQLAERSGELDKLKFIEDYHMGNDGRKRFKITNDDFLVHFSAQFGGSEGIYIDAYINGRFDASGEHKRVSIGTIKTLEDDLAAMKIMGEACGILTYNAAEYLNQNYARYMEIPKTT